MDGWMLSGNNNYKLFEVSLKTLQELRMLSSVTLDCQVTKTAMNSGSQLSELSSESQKSLGLSKLPEIVKVVRNCQICQKLSKLSELLKLSEIVMSPHHSDQMIQRSQVSRIAL